MGSKTVTTAFGALAPGAVSAQLRKELPGLRGFSERNLYYMKTFYEEWSPFLGPGSNFAVAIAELPSDEILQLQLQKAEGFPVEEFLSIGFTLRSQILTSAMDYDERVVEQAIVNNVKNFIMEFGRGFSFIGNAYHLDAFGEDQFIDLLFFNRDLNCLVAVELKRGKSYGCASLPQGRLRQPRTKL